MAKSSAGTGDGQRRIVENPFHVLGLRPEAGRLEVEREGQKLLGMLDLGLKAAATYRTPLGPQTRTADRVRVAMAELRDPEKRLLHEFWAVLPPRAEPPRPPPPTRAEHDLEPFTAAFASQGWRRP